MFIPFEKIPSGSRIWVYQADRKFSEAEVNEIEQQSKAFLDDWAAHGSQLACSAVIFHAQFLVLSVFEDFQQPSGCSIDSSVHFIQDLEKQYNVNFMDRSKVAFINNGEVFLESLPNIKKRIAEGTIKEDTLTFNNLIERKDDLENRWLVPAKNSWLNRYFKVKN
jgi:hypothetical protein